MTHSLPQHQSPFINLPSSLCFPSLSHCLLSPYLHLLLFSIPLSYYLLSTHLHLFLSASLPLSFSTSVSLSRLRRFLLLPPSHYVSLFITLPSFCVLYCPSRELNNTSWLMELSVNIYGCSSDHWFWMSIQRGCGEKYWKLLNLTSQCTMRRNPIVDRVKTPSHPPSFRAVQMVSASTTTNIGLYTAKLFHLPRQQNR